MSRAPAAAADARGSALLWVLFVVIVVSGNILFGLQADLALDLATRVEVESPSQARAVAEAGLVDAYAWFRRQPVQPVTSFTPGLDLTLTPPLNETDDPVVGLVREYEIAPNLWARYEVRRTAEAEPFTDVNGDGLYGTGEPFTDFDGDGRWDAAGETRDVTATRGLPGQGAVWFLVSHGMVFARPRHDLGLGEGPNRRLAIARLATEIRRLALTLPASAAFCVARGDAALVGDRGRVRGAGGAGLAYAASTGVPAVLAGAEVSGSPSTTALPDYDGSLEAVFGVGLGELRAMADLATSDPASLPAPLGDFTLSVVEGDVVFDRDRPLRGTGILAVLGDCRVEDGSNSFFNGLLWVQGDLTLRAPAYLRGTVIVQGSLDARGTGGDYVEVDRDEAILGELLALMGQYRHTRSVHRHDPQRLQRDRTATP